MNFTFYKYQGTGNDFVIIDNRNLFFDKNDVQLIKKVCDRRFGIGGDGLILLENDKIADFKMLYFNADGREGSMCGNGGRCIVHFAKFLEIINSETTFIAADGDHFATINDGIVTLQMNEVSKIEVFEKYAFLNTGSPQHVQIVEDLENYPVYKEGQRIRHEIYGEKGSNINFVEKVSETEFTMRTFERGVEDETLACGTGATAVAITMNAIGEATNSKIKLNVRGGSLWVRFKKENTKYSEIFLEGAAVQVFKGEWK